MGDVRDLLDFLRVNECSMIQVTAGSSIINEAVRRVSSLGAVSARNFLNMVCDAGSFKPLKSIV